jgi:hypothetical protein
VRYGCRQVNARASHRESTSVRQRNFRAEGRNIQPSHNFTQVPEFEPMNMSEGGRPEQVGGQAGRSVANNSNQGNC